MGNDSTNYIVSGKQLNNIGNAIISKGGASSALTVDDMPDAIRRISTSVSTKSLGIYEQTCNVDDSNGNILGYITIHCDPKDESGYVYVPSDGRNPSGEKIHITSSSLKPGNIRNGVKIMGVEGNYSGSGDRSALVYSGVPSSSRWIKVDLPDGDYMFMIGASAWSGSLMVDNNYGINLGLVDNYYVGFYSGRLHSFWISQTPSFLEIYDLS